MQLDYWSILQLLLEIAIFLLLMVVIKFCYRKFSSNETVEADFEKYLPLEEIQSLRQIWYLMMMGFCFINVLYSLIFLTNDLIYFVLFDVLVSLYIACQLDLSTSKNKILLVLLVPYGSLTYVLFGNSLVGLVDLVHVPVFIYFIKVYFDKFRSYTEVNGLGITVVLLFAIIFISFLFTQAAENVNPLDALVMVSNAFTSNGYAVLGSSIPGKINAIVLVWSGYLLSGVGTATLAAAILTRHFNKKFEELEDLIKNKGDD